MMARVGEPTLTLGMPKREVNASSMSPTIWLNERGTGIVAMS